MWGNIVPLVRKYAFPVYHHFSVSMLSFGIPCFCKISSNESIMGGGPHTIQSKELWFSLVIDERKSSSDILRSVKKLSKINQVFTTTVLYTYKQGRDPDGCGVYTEFFFIIKLLISTILHVDPNHRPTCKLIAQIYVHLIFLLYLKFEALNPLSQSHTPSIRKSYTSPWQ